MEGIISHSKTLDEVEVEKENKIHTEAQFGSINIVL